MTMIPLIQVPPLEYGCSICKALNFPTLWEANLHCKAENKGKRKDSQWRHETILRRQYAHGLEATTGPGPVRILAKSGAHLTVSNRKPEK